MGKRRIAICPKCEKIYELTQTQTEAWCQHIEIRKKYVDGPEEVKHIRMVPKSMADVIKIKCRITEIE